MLTLAVQTCPSGSRALERHWPYYVKNSGASILLVVGTNDGYCEMPVHADKFAWIGKNSYINGNHLPQRLVDTLDYMLEHFDGNFYMVCEYDTVFFRRIELENLDKEVASHYAGGPTWGSLASGFYHNPWLFTREAAQKFVKAGQDAIDEGVCGVPRENAYGNAEASPDVFFGYVTELLGYEVQSDLWTEFSRNDLKEQENLDQARQAYRDGIDVIHGIKTEEELHYITT